MRVETTIESPRTPYFLWNYAKTPVYRKAYDLLKVNIKYFIPNRYANHRLFLLKFY